MKIEYLKEVGILLTLYKSMLTGFITGLILYYVKVVLDKKGLKEKNINEQLKYGGILGIMTTLYTTVCHIIN